MVASSLFYYPPTTATNPPFIVNPNVNFDPATATDVPAAQATADQLIFYYDNVLPYEATLATTILSTSQQVAQLGQVGDNASFQISLRDPTQAASAASLFASYGMSILFRSSGYTYQLAAVAQQQHQCQPGRLPRLQFQLHRRGRVRFHIQHGCSEWHRCQPHRTRAATCVIRSSRKRWIRPRPFRRHVWSGMK